MELIKIEAKDVTITFQMTLTELEKLKTVLDISEIKYSNNEEKEASNFLTKLVYPFIISTIEKIKGTE